MNNVGAIIQGLIARFKRVNMCDERQKHRELCSLGCNEGKIKIPVDRPGEVLIHLEPKRKVTVGPIHH